MKFSDFRGKFRCWGSSNSTSSFYFPYVADSISDTDSGSESDTDVDPEHDTAVILFDRRGEVTAAYSGHRRSENGTLIHRYSYSVQCVGTSDPSYREKNPDLSLIQGGISSGVQIAERISFPPAATGEHNQEIPLHVAQLESREWRSQDSLVEQGTIGEPQEPSASTRRGVPGVGWLVVAEGNQQELSDEQGVIAEHQKPSNSNTSSDLRDAGVNLSRRSESLTGFGDGIMHSSRSRRSRQKSVHRRHRRYLNRPHALPHRRRQKGFPNRLPGHMYNATNDLAAHVAKDLLMLLLLPVAITLSVLTVDLDPGGEEN